MNLGEEFLSENKNKKLGINHIKRELSMKGRTVKYFINQSEHIRQVEPYEVGSGKSKISVYTYE